MKSTPESIDAALLDVRRAFRLLHDYQRLALDAIGYIGRQFELEYVGGWPKFSDVTPRPGKGELDCWAWDFLNLMEYDFHFTKTLPDKKVLKFSVLLISDSGFFLRQNKEAEATDTPQFLPAQSSETLIAILMSAKEWPPMEFMKPWVGMTKFIETMGEVPTDLTSAGVIAKCFPFSRLASEEDTNRLIDEIAAFAKSNGIPLKRI